MGIWAEIKHALNSTLGTTSFKPLNTLITDYVASQASSIKSAITSAKEAILESENYGYAALPQDTYNYFNTYGTRLVGSEDVFFTYDGEWEEKRIDGTSSSNYRTTSSYITFGRSGTVNFRWTQSNHRNSGSDTTTSFKISVYNKTGTEVGSKLFNYIPVGQNKNDLYEFILPLNVTSGEKYKIELYCVLDGHTVNKQLAVCATLVLGSANISLTT